VSKDGVNASFDRLVEIMATLRGPDGCPWDKEQDLDTLKPMLIEEVYEVIDAVDRKDYRNLCEELGDVLLHIVFHAQLGKEAGQFTIDQVIEGISEKLIRRHPHVFGDDDASDSAQVLENWEAIKMKEKEDQGQVPPEDHSVLDSIPPVLPALHEAHKISSKVARLGFEWPHIDDVFGKLDEEVGELREAMAQSDSDVRQDQIEDEVGDAFFVLVNIARHLNIDSESALNRSNRKFRSRFRHLESAFASEGKTVEDASLAEMEAMWQKAKKDLG
jgi:MazG family protein